MSRTFHKTIFTPAVEVEGHFGCGYACATENAVDRAIDRALDQTAGHFMAFSLRLVSVTHSAVRYGDRTYLIVTIVAEETGPAAERTGSVTPRWKHPQKEEEIK